MNMTPTIATMDASAAALGAFEMAALLSIALASALLTFVANEQLAAVVARRLLTLINVFAAITLAFQADYARVGRYCLAALGMSVLNSVLVAVVNVLDSDARGGSKKLA